MIAALERFKRYCQFDPLTGCVLWVGATTSGRGNTALYPSFWYDRRRWFGHRWAAAHIHGLDIVGMDVDHCCPAHRAGAALLLPNTLCVQHVQAIDSQTNGELRWQRQRWLLVSKGYEEGPPPFEPLQAGGVPIHLPPTWLDTAVNYADEDCPF